MKTTLYDLTTRGIIFVVDGNLTAAKWEMSLMRSCILDTSLSKLIPSLPLYNEITNTTVQEQFYVTGRGLNIAIGDENLKTYYFTQKQQTAFLIYPLIKALTTHLQSRSLTFIEDHALPMDDTIALAVLESDPNTETYSTGVLEYAATLDITPLQAYNELKLDYETVHSIKMRVYAITKKYVSLIRAVTTKEQADLLLAEINQKLYVETFI
jgi:hypothetical protein